MLIDINEFAKKLLELEHLYITADIALRQEEEAIQQKGLFKRMSYAVLGSPAKAAVQARWADLSSVEANAEATIAAWLEESVELGLAESGRIQEVTAHATRWAQLRASLARGQALISGLESARAQLQCAGDPATVDEAPTHWLAAHTKLAMLEEALTAFLSDVPVEAGHATLLRMLASALKDVSGEMATPAFDFKRHCLNAADTLQGIRLNAQGLCRTLEQDALEEAEAIDEIEGPFRMDGICKLPAVLQRFV